MSRAFKRNFLQHSLAVRRWCERRKASGGIDPFSLSLDLELAGRRVRLQPQFIVEPVPGQIGFVPMLDVGVSGFVGWFPYGGKAWPITQDKLLFKDFARTAGLRVPKAGIDAEGIRGPYIVKRRKSTFGRGLRGPYPAGHAPDLIEDEYWEQFVPGRMLKAWYWDQEPVVVELIDLPTVRGDGIKTLRQLIDDRLPPDAPFPEDVDGLAHWQGLALDSVVPAGRSVIADYRYMSLLNPSAVTDHDVRDRIRGTALEAQLREAGERCWMAIPQEMRNGTMFSIDGMVDPEGNVWFLETNCNPQLHPAVYDAMLDGMFSLKAEGGLV